MTFRQFCDPAYRRSEQMKVKSEAVWAVFRDLDGLVNVSKFSKTYFGKSQSWFVQKLNGMTVCGKQRSFTDEECRRLAESLRDIASRLETYADGIDRAE